MSNGEGDGYDIGYGVEIDCKYEVGEEFREFEYFCGLYGEVNDIYVELSFVCVRVVSKKNKVFFEVDLFFGNVRIKVD